LKKWWLVALSAALMVILSPVLAQDQITIEFVHIFGAEGDTRADVIRAIANDFEAKTGVKVNISSPSTGYTELFNSVLLNAEQGRAPHVVQVEEGLTQLAADSGYFIPIEELASEEQLASFEDFIPTVRAYYEIDGVNWSVPWNSSNPVVYYNKTITDLLQIEIPADRPLTFGEVEAICQRVMVAAPAIRMAAENFRACISWPMASWFLEQWMSMKGELVALPGNGREGQRVSATNYDSEAMVEIVSWIGDMAKKGYYTYSGTPNDYNGEGALFGTGTTVMHINSTAGITLFVAGFANAGVKLGIAPLFVPDEDATNGVTVGGASLWVTGGHSDAETQAAVDFIFFMTETANDMRFHQGSGYFPNRLSSIEALTNGGLFVDSEGNLTSPSAEGAKEVSWFETYPFFRIALDQLLASKGTIANAGAVVGPSAEVRLQLVRAVQSVVDQGIDPAEALAAAKAQADAIIADYNSVIGD